jgi:AcrR family transcriptional regulator
MGVEKTSPPRADARRNRAKVLDAARDVLLERGTDARLDEIARRAGVGIATLYRRFPERRHLMREVAIEALDEAIAIAEEARSNEAEPFAALARYLRGAVTARIGAVLPLLSDESVMENPGVTEACERLSYRVQAMIAAAQHAGTLRADVSGTDIGLLLVRVCAPLPSPVSREVDPAVAERHLQIVLDGLRAKARGGTGTDAAPDGGLSTNAGMPPNGPVARDVPGFGGLNNRFDVR